MYQFSPVTHIFPNLNAKRRSVGLFLGPLETGGHTRLKVKPGNQSTAPEVQEKLAKRLTVCRCPSEVGQCASLSGFDLRKCTRCGEEMMSAFRERLISAGENQVCLSCRCARMWSGNGAIRVTGTTSVHQCLRPDSELPRNESSQHFVIS